MPSFNVGDRVHARTNLTFSTITIPANTCGTVLSVFDVEQEDDDLFDVHFDGDPVQSRMVNTNRLAPGCPSQSTVTALTPKSFTRKTASKRKPKSKPKKKPS